MNAPICLHARQSARLSFNPARALQAHLCCDDCGLRLRYLAEQTLAARSAYTHPEGPVIAAA